MPIRIRLESDIEKRLEALARITGRSKSSYIREAVLEHLDDMEDLYLAEARLKNLQAGHSETVPLDAVMRRYGLED